MATHVLDRYSRFIGVGMTGEALGYPGSIESIVERAGKLNRYDLLYASSRLMFDLDSADADEVRPRQLAFLRSLPGELAALIAAKLEAGSKANGFDQIFYQQQLMVLMRLALRHGQDGPPTRFDEFKRWDEFLILAAQIVDVIHSVGPQLSGGQVLDTPLSHHPLNLHLALYLARQRVANGQAFPKASGGRSFLLWHASTVPWPSNLETLDEFCERTLGMPLRTFVAIAIAHPLTSYGTEDIRFSPRHVFSNTAVDSTLVSKVFDFITFCPEQLPTDDSPAFYWDFLDHFQQPYLPYSEQTVITTSVGRAFEGPTSQLFWLMESDYRKSGKPSDCDKLRTHYGKLFEDYCFRLAASIESQVNRVLGEIKYKAEAGGAAASSDILIESTGPRGPYWVFIECATVRPRRAVFASADLTAFQEYVERLAAKAAQVSTSLGAFRSGRLEIPGANDPKELRVVPVVVVDEPFISNGFLINILESRLSELNAFDDRYATKPIFISLSELEYLIYAVESRGESIAEILVGYLLDTNRRVRLLDYMFERFGTLNTPTFVRCGFEEFGNYISPVLYPNDPPAGDALRARLRPDS